MPWMEVRGIDSYRNGLRRIIQLRDRLNPLVFCFVFVFGRGRHVVVFQGIVSSNVCNAFLKKIKDDSFDN